MNFAQKFLDKVFSKSNSQQQQVILKIVSHLFDNKLQHKDIQIIIKKLDDKKDLKLFAFFVQSFACELNRHYYEKPIQKKNNEKAEILFVDDKWQRSWKRIKKQLKLSQRQKDDKIFQTLQKMQALSVEMWINSQNGIAIEQFLRSDEKSIQCNQYTRNLDFKNENSQIFAFINATPNLWKQVKFYYNLFKSKQYKDKTKKQRKKYLEKIPLILAQNKFQFDFEKIKLKLLQQNQELQQSQSQSEMSIIQSKPQVKQEEFSQFQDITIEAKLRIFCENIQQTQQQYMIQPLQRYLEQLREKHGKKSKIMKSLQVQKEKIIADLKKLETQISSCKTAFSSQNSKTFKEEQKMQKKYLMQNPQMLNQNENNTFLNPIQIMIGQISQMLENTSILDMAVYTEMESKIKEKQNKISELQRQINKKKQQLGDKQMQVQKLSEQIKKKQNKISELQGQINKKKQQLGDKQMQVSELSEQVKKKQNKISELQGQINKKKQQLRSKQMQASELSKLVSKKQQEIKEIQKQTSKINDNQKDLQGQLAQKKKQLDLAEYNFTELSLQVKRLNEQKDALAQKLENSIPHHMFFQGDIFSNNETNNLKWLIESMQQWSSRKVVWTKQIYRKDSLNKTNFHAYIDGLPNIFTVIELANGNIVAGFSEAAISQTQKFQDKSGFLLSFKEKKRYHLKSQDKQRPNTKPRPVTWDDYYIIYGNSQIRLRFGEDLIFSNFGIVNSHYNANGDTINSFLGQGKQREVEIKRYEIYQVFFH